MLERVFRKLYNQATIRTAIKAGMEVGPGARFLGAHDFGSEPYLIKMGKNVTVSSDVTFINHDGGTAVVKRLNPEKYGHILKFGKIIIGDNCFIGAGSIIMPGVTIGNNSVIGAGSVVTKDIPENSVAAGVPARIIKNIDEYAEAVYEATPVYDLHQYNRNKKETILQMLEDSKNIL